MKIKKIVIILLFLFFTVSLANTSAANEEVIRVGYIDYDNFINKDEKTEKYTGYAVDYLKEINKYTGWKVEFVFDAWNNILNRLSTDIDFVCQAQKTIEREEKYIFSDYSIGSESNVLYVNSGDKRYYYNDFQAFNGMNIAVLKGSFQNERFSQYAKLNNFTYNEIEFDTEAECFDKLDKGLIDGVALGSLSLKRGYKAVCRFGSDPFYIMSSPRMNSQMTMINYALGQIKANNPTFEGNLYNAYYAQALGSNEISFTREESNFLASNTSITMNFIPNRTPLSYLEDGKVKGVTKDIIDLIETRSGLSINAQMLPVGMTSTQYLANKPDEFLAGVVKENTDFDENYSVTNSFYSDSVVLAGLGDKAYNINSPEGTYKLAVVKTNKALTHYLENNHKEFTLVLCDSMEACAKMVIDGKADFLAQNNKVLQQFIQKPRYSSIRILPSVFSSETFIIVSSMSDRNELITSIIDKVIQTISEEEIDQIVLNQVLITNHKHTFKDMIYIYRIPVVIISILIVLITLFLVSSLIYRNSNYKKIDKMNKQLELAIDKANVANQTKTRFLAQISHEIRTPMNAIIGLTNLAKYEINEPKKTADYLNKIDTSSKVLLGIINDVLDMSAIEGGKIKVDNSEFDFKHLIENVTSMYYQQAKQKNVEFKCRICNLTEEVLIGDELRVNQIILNLLSNALKFTDEGSVTLDIIQSGISNNKVYIRFIVEDTGCGMSEDMQSRLFLPFEQESVKTAQKHGGSGLGLSIAKSLIDLMNGTISVKSVQGEGTTFTVDIPFEISKNNEEITETDFSKIKALIVDDDQESGNYCGKLLERLNVKYDTVTDGYKALEKMGEEDDKHEPYTLCLIDWKMPSINGIELTKKIREIFGRDTIVIIVSAYDLNELDGSEMAKESDYFIPKPLFQSTVYNALVKIFNKGAIKRNYVSNKQYDFTGKRILVAEDVDLNMEVVVKILTRVGAEVVETKDGKEALATYLNHQENYFDAILLDINMPFMNGYEVCKEIRKKEVSKRVPIFAMTANAFSTDVNEALDSGMNGHIAKPIDVDVLYKTLDLVFKGDENNE